jgi:hypothetical protein
LIDPAKLEPRLANRFLSRQSRGHTLLDGTLHVKAKLVVEFLLDGCVAKQRAEAVERIGQHVVTPYFSGVGY